MKKVLSIVLSLAMILSTVAFAAPVIRFDEVESATEADVNVSETATLAAVEVNGKWGVIDKSDNLVIPFKYDYVGDL